MKICENDDDEYDKRVTAAYDNNGDLVIMMIIMVIVVMASIVCVSSLHNTIGSSSGNKPMRYTTAADDSFETPRSNAFLMCVSQSEMETMNCSTMKLKYLYIS